MIIIGGGVNGLAIARDAAIRGLSVRLVERDDFGSETSSWSSRMIHGGLRYLEHLDLGLVRESLVEREALLRTAPHLVRPMRLIIPIYDEGTRGRWTIRAGMILYDLLSAGKSVGRHRFLSPEAVTEEVPGLRVQGLRGAAAYTDGQVELSERLCVELALDAARHGAALLTKTTAIEVARADHGVEVRTEGPHGTQLFTASMAINATGPWVDEVLAGVRSNRRLIGGTRGSHIAVRRFEGAPTTTIHFETETGKPLLVIPWRGTLLVGSTDVLDDETKDRRPRISRDEHDLLLSQVNRLFPQANLTAQDVLFTYSGIRPLPHSPGTHATAITRRHAVHVHPEFDRRVVSIIGGKLTTHRSLAEETVDIVLKTLGRPMVRSTTKTMTFPGFILPRERPALVDRLRKAGISSDTATAVVDRYGRRATLISQLIQQDRSLADELPIAGHVAAEVVLAVESERAQSLTDVIYRRLACRFDLVTAELVEAVAALLRSKCGWTADRAATDRAELTEHARRVDSKPFDAF